MTELAKTSEMLSIEQRIGSTNPGSRWEALYKAVELATASDAPAGAVEWAQGIIAQGVADQYRLTRATALKTTAKLALAPNASARTQEWAQNIISTQLRTDQNPFVRAGAVDAATDLALAPDAPVGAVEWLQEIIQLAAKDQYYDVHVAVSLAQKRLQQTSGSGRTTVRSSQVYGGR